MFNFNSLLDCSYAERWAYNFQDPASDWMFAIIELHDRIIFYLVIILVVVVWFLISGLNNKDHMANLHHGNIMELFWTLSPAGILWAIGQPSLRLLYIMDEVLDATVTVKCIASQWYHNNAINKSKFFVNKNKILKDLSLKHLNSLIVLNPSWVTGFSDAEGCFYINIQNIKKGNKYITPTFKIAQDYKDIDILYSLKNYFKIGQITIHKKEARFEIMGYYNAIKYVIPHFDKYPQITNKFADYVLWKNIIMIQNSKQHLTIDDFLKCLSFKASLNKGLNKTLKVLFPNIIPAPIPVVLQPDTINPNWLSGFTAGDGSFMISIHKNLSCKTGYQVQAAFNIDQHSRDIEQINLIKDFQGCGKVYQQKTDSRIIVKNFRDLQKYIIPHFSKYPLINIKQHNFIIWCQIVTMIENGDHLTNDGLEQIRFMRENMRQG